MREYTVREYDREDYYNFRENLTIPQTIELLKRIQRGHIPDYNFDGSEEDFDNYCLQMAMYKAIKILDESNKKTLNGEDDDYGEE